jgi:hypothetical protein
LEYSIGINGPAPDKCLVNLTSQPLITLIASAGQLSGEMDDRITTAGDILRLNLSEVAGE